MVDLFNFDVTFISEACQDDPCNPAEHVPGYPICCSEWEKQNKKAKQSFKLNIRKLSK